MGQPCVESGSLASQPRPSRRAYKAIIYYRIYRERAAWRSANVVGPRRSRPLERHKGRSLQEARMAISTPAENRHSPGPLRLPILPQLGAWTRSGPEESRKGSILGDHALAWSAWQAYLAQRDHPRPLAELLPSRTPPLAWALAEIPGIEDLDAMRSRLTAIGCPPRGRRAERLADQWLGAKVSPGGHAGPDYGRVLEALAWCHVLPGVCQVAGPGCLVATPSGSPYPGRRGGGR